MLKVKAFKITDDEGINELLSKYKIAQGGSILVSEGNVLIPYDDEQPENEKILLKSIVNEHKGKLMLLNHSQKVLERIVRGAKEKINELEQKLALPENQEVYKEKKAINDEIRRLQSVVDQNENQILMNKAEGHRIQVNIDVAENE